MTYAELCERMSSAEFEMWQAYELAREHECPSCGLEPREGLEDGYQAAKVKCPICNHEWQRIVQPHIRLVKPD